MPRWITDHLSWFAAIPNQFAVEFVQIGADPGACKYLERLDTDLCKSARREDTVDLIPWTQNKINGPQFDGDYLVKFVCGVINKGKTRSQ